MNVNCLDDMKNKFKRIRWKQYLPLAGLLVMLVAIVAGSLNIGQVRQWFGNASGVEANMVVETQTVLGPLPRPWRNLAQGGESHEYRFTSVIDQVKSVHPEYVRIDHVYDFYEIVGRNGEGQLTFDWNRLDPVLDDILMMGAKPFISLSYMPPAISSGDVTDKPRNWTEWQVVVQKTIEHISGHRGRNIANVYYEVWNEPDLFGGWKTYGDKNYLDLYRYAAYGAKSTGNVQAFKLGGPAITAYYEAWVDNLLTFVEKNNLRFDFFSWHRYHTNVDEFVSETRAIDLALEKHPRLLLSVEKIISEWGFNPEVDAGYDGAYGAAHMVAVATELPKWVDRAFVFEIQDGKDPAGKEFWGRWGLFTNSDFGSRSKPRFRALQMLEQLGEERLSMYGKGTWVRGLATKNGTITRTLLVNYDPSGRHSENVPVTFTQVRPGEFLLKQRFLDGKLQMFSLATTGATLRHQVVMPAESVVMLELEQTKVIR